MAVKIIMLRVVVEGSTGDDDDGSWWWWSSSCRAADIDTVMEAAVHQAETG